MDTNSGYSYTQCTLLDNHNTIMFRDNANKISKVSCNAHDSEKFSMVKYLNTFASHCKRYFLLLCKRKFLLLPLKLSTTSISQLKEFITHNNGTSAQKASPNMIENDPRFSQRTKGLCSRAAACLSTHDPSLARRFRSAKWRIVGLIPTALVQTVMRRLTVAPCLRIRCNQTQNRPSKYPAICQS